VLCSSIHVSILNARVHAAGDRPAQTGPARRTRGDMSVVAVACAHGHRQQRQRREGTRAPLRSPLRAASPAARSMAMAGKGRPASNEMISPDAIAAYSLTIFVLMLLK
jgi:hypothetical protein